MYIHKEGYKIIAVSAVITFGLTALIASFIGNEVIRYFLFIVLTGIFIWTISFFRVPRRKSPTDQQNAVISSADGKVVTIEEVEETEYFKDKRIQISVFMSPFNVHVNWFPIAGMVSYTKYHPGKFLVAYHPKSSTENERNTIVVKSDKGTEVLVRQIAGMMARRIISYAKKGDKATRGEEFGIIRFGSRVDFFVPLDAEIVVSLGDKVSGKKTVLARLKN